MVRVLVAEGDPALRKAIVGWFRDAGLKITAVGGYMSARRVLRKSKAPFDLLLFAEDTPVSHKGQVCGVTRPDGCKKMLRYLKKQADREAETPGVKRLPNDVAVMSESTAAVATRTRVLLSAFENPMPQVLQKGTLVADRFNPIIKALKP